MKFNSLFCLMVFLVSFTSFDSHANKRKIVETLLETPVGKIFITQTTRGVRLAKDVIGKRITTSAEYAEFVSRYSKSSTLAEVKSLHAEMKTLANHRNQFLSANGRVWKPELLPGFRRYLSNQVDSAGRYYQIYDGVPLPGSVSIATKEKAIVRVSPNSSSGTLVRTETRGKLAVGRLEIQAFEAGTKLDEVFLAIPDEQVLKFYDDANLVFLNDTPYVRTSVALGTLKELRKKVASRSRLSSDPISTYVHQLHFKHKYDLPYGARGHFASAELRLNYKSSQDVSRLPDSTPIDERIFTKPLEELEGQAWIDLVIPKDGRRHRLFLSDSQAVHSIRLRHVRSERGIVEGEDKVIEYFHARVSASNDIQFDVIVRLNREVKPDGYYQIGQSGQAKDLIELKDAVAEVGIRKVQDVSDDMIRISR